LRTCLISHAHTAMVAWLMIALKAAVSKADDDQRCRSAIRSGTLIYDRLWALRSFGASALSRTCFWQTNSYRHPASKLALDCYQATRLLDDAMHSTNISPRPDPCPTVFVITACAIINPLSQR
jgi:hypothetical protein